MIIWLLVPLVAGPLAASPAWSHQEDLCIHSLCGSYSDPRTGTVVDYVVSDERLPWDDPCHVPTSGVAFQGSVGGIRYCGFEAADAQEVELEELERTAPDLLCYVGDPDRVIMAQVEASLICVTFVAGNTIYQFCSETCDIGQVAAFRNLVLENDSLRAGMARQ
jgi:hypothetical protein